MKLRAISARDFAAGAHAGVGQIRKYTGEPYITHPERVAALVELYGGNEDQICAAYLHDVVEDTKATLEDIKREFGKKVASLVDQVTDVSKPDDGNRAKRKEMDRMHLMSITPEGKMIKLADLIDNSRSIVEHDPDFAVRYIREKRAVLMHLREGNEKLYELANAILTEYEEKRYGNQVSK